MEQLYASFQRRMIAHLIDIAICFAFAFLVLVLLALRMGEKNAVFIVVSTFGLFNIFVMFYHIILPCTKLQGTIGKMIARIKIVDADGKRISIVQSIGRFFISFCSGVVFCYIGHLAMLSNKDSQAVHDLLVKSYVVHK